MQGSRVQGHEGIRVQERKVVGSQVHEGARVQENESAMVFTLAHLKFMMN